MGWGGREGVRGESSWLDLWLHLQFQRSGQAFHTDPSSQGPRRLPHRAGWQQGRSGNTAPGLGSPLPPTPTPSQSGMLLLTHFLMLLTSTSSSDSLRLQPRTPLVIVSESPALPIWEFSGEVVEWEKRCLRQGPPAPALFRPIPSSCSHLEPGLSLLWIFPLQPTSRSSCPSAHTPARPPGP